MTLLVDHDDAVGVHQTVGDNRGGRRRDHDPFEIEMTGRLHTLDDSVLLRAEVVDDARADVAPRGLKAFRRLELASRCRIQRFD